MRSQRLDLGHISDEYEPSFTNKKVAAQSETLSLQLQEHGYQFPTHWKRSGLPRPFVAWDGEGITYPGNQAQSYVLFGASTGDRISGRELGTQDCFDLLLEVERQYPDAIHVGFAVQYDCNMIFRDLERRHLERIYRSNACRWNGYRIEYRPGKWLSISRAGTSVRLFDVFGYFQSSFVTACEKFLGKDDPELVGIREGKAARSAFLFEQLHDFIIPYWEAELRLLVRLMDSLRDDLESAELRINSWHGPGSVANTVFRKHHIDKAKAETPKEVNRAAQYGYSGGRFELFRCGHHPGKVWEYDINSAYPSAIAELPDLQRGSWRLVKSFEPGSFGIWHVRYDATGTARDLFTQPQPIFYRDPHGNVSYPPLVEGWYWTPEAALVPSESIKEGWVFDNDGSKPFAFVREMYEQRRTWKQQGNSAERALKLALNSLYGKMAQRVGWRETDHATTPTSQGIPRWHQLEWAGFVTSATRAKLWTVIAEARESIIAVETDAIFTSRPLPDLPIGEELGQWTETTFDWITYLQNGLYYAGSGSDIQEKYRGFDRGSLSYSTVREYLRASSDGDTAFLSGVTTRFIGLGLGLHTRAHWRSWNTDRRNVVLGGAGKRSHVPGLCTACKAGVRLDEGLHPMQVITAGGVSHPHSLPWLDELEPVLRAEDELARW